MTPLYRNWHGGYPSHHSIAPDALPFRAGRILGASSVWVEYQDCRRAASTDACAAVPALPDRRRGIDEFLETSAIVNVGSRKADGKAVFAPSVCRCCRRSRHHPRSFSRVPTPKPRRPSGRHGRPATAASIGTGLGNGKGLPAPFPGSGRPREALAETGVDTSQPRTRRAVGAPGPQDR